MKDKQAKTGHQSISHAEFISASSTHVIARGQQQRQALKILNQVQNDGTYFNNDGFTLIELLVVVLIIGILASVALPQYQKAVDRSRFAQVKSVFNGIQKAQQLYRMENGAFAAKLSALDLPPSGCEYKSGNESMCFYSWGYCYLACNPTGTCGGCLMQLTQGKDTDNVILFARGDGNWTANSCYATTTSARAKKLCQAETGRATGGTDGSYTTYSY